MARDVSSAIVLHAGAIESLEQTKSLGILTKFAQGETQSAEVNVPVCKAAVLILRALPGGMLEYGIDAMIMIVTDDQFDQLMVNVAVLFLPCADQLISPDASEFALLLTLAGVMYSISILGFLLTQTATDRSL